MPNLILVHQEDKQDRADYAAIARKVDVEVFIVDTKDPGIDDPRFDAAQPTLTVSPMPIKKFRPPRGPVCQGFEFPKSEQYERLARLGLPVPRWISISPGISLDAREWGPYVVVKPDLGRKGAEIFIKRTGRVRYRSPGFLAQQFVYTGRWPVNYRVVTLFGRTLMSWRCEANHRLVPLESRWDFKARGGITVVSNKRDSRYTLASEPDVIALAEKAHAAFPDQPLLGTDIARDAESGSLHLLECNPRGDAWLISSVMGRMIEQANGLDFASQFGAIEVAARTLAEETHRRAA
ncbi:MAG TPA: hypothetical protein VFC18_09585 [Burkholderiales bacterium]|nr:hypothetical protein [Burkholderiales bacterium]